MMLGGIVAILLAISGVTLHCFRVHLVHGPWFMVQCTPTSHVTSTCLEYAWHTSSTFISSKNIIHVFMLAVYLLATDCIVTMPYKIVYLDSKLVTATMHGCYYNIQYLDIVQVL